MRLIAALMLLVTAAPAVAADDKQPNEKLCSIKTVYIEGHGSNAKWYRDNLEKHTWLKITTILEQADAVFAVGGVGSTVFPIKATLTRRNPTEHLWDGSSRTNPLKFWGGGPRPGLLKKLNKAANCQAK